MEIFGPTIQGEGALVGLPCHFIRFGGCDFSCWWCDTAHAVLPQNVRNAQKMTVTEMVIAVLDLPHLSADWVTLSGGNPALHDLSKLVNSLHGNGFKVAVETQGSRWQDWITEIDQVTVSPKPPSSRMVNPFLPTFMERLLEVKYVGQNFALKVPVYDEEDLDWALDLHNQYDVPFFISIVTEMGGLYGDFADGRVDTADTLLARYHLIVETVLKRGVPDVRIIPQMHYLVWGNKVGV